MRYSKGGGPCLSIFDVARRYNVWKYRDSGQTGSASLHSVGEQRRTVLPSYAIQLGTAIEAIVIPEAGRTKSVTFRVSPAVF